jgi:hypothetical protein
MTLCKMYGCSVPDFQHELSVTSVQKLMLNAVLRTSCFSGQHGSIQVQALSLYTNCKRRARACPWAPYLELKHAIS